MSIVREVLTLLYDTFRPRCTLCGRRGCRFSDFRPSTHADDALRSDGP